MSKVKKTEHKEFDIPFSGLKTGVHEYEFQLEPAFFASFNLDELSEASLKGFLSLEKKPNLLEANFRAEGVYSCTCDRCADEIELSINGSLQHIYKFGEGESQSEEVSVLSEHEHIINVAPHFYELCFLSLSNKRLCEDAIDTKACNAEVLERLEELLPGAEQEESEIEEIDPRWAALKNLKK